MTRLGRCIALDAALLSISAATALKAWHIGWVWWAPGFALGALCAVRMLRHDFRA